jgi:hypothetical protein
MDINRQPASGYLHKIPNRSQLLIIEETPHRMVEIDEIFFIYASSSKRTLQRHLLSIREGVLAYRHQNTCMIQDQLGVLKTKYYVTH